MPTADDPTPVGKTLRAAATELAAALLARGYDAHAHCSEVAVEIRAVHITGWRYPDGHWEFHDQPAHITADLHTPGELSWWFADHHRDLAVPRYGSAAATAQWLSYELPAPERPTIRLEHHPDTIDAESGPIPPDWFDAWNHSGSGAAPRSPDHITLHAEETSCPALAITASASDSRPQGSPAFILIHTPTGLPLAAARARGPLRELAARFAWFDDRAVDPDYLADAAHADIAAGIIAILDQWRTEHAWAHGQRLLLSATS